MSVRPSVDDMVSGAKLKFALEFQFQISYTYSLWLWTEACSFSAMSLSRWPPGSHIGFLGFRTLSFSLALNIQVQTSLAHHLCIWEEAY